MTEQDRRESTPAAGDETFLARWSRRKARARADEVPDPEPAQSTTVAASAAEPTAPSTSASAAAPAPVIPLPNLDDLHQDSDYSAFLAPGVDGALRRSALRKLFASPKFNVFDGLDTYRDDYTQFPALGDVMTADMRHHAERLARKLLEEGDAPATAGATAAPPADEVVAASADPPKAAPADASAADPAEDCPVTPVAADTPDHPPMAPADTDTVPAEDEHVRDLPA